MARREGGQFVGGVESGADGKGGVWIEDASIAESLMSFDEKVVCGRAFVVSVGFETFASVLNVGPGFPHLRENEGVDLG